MENMSSDAESLNKKQVRETNRRVGPILSGWSRKASVVGTTCEATWLELEVGEGGQVQGLGVQCLKQRKYSVQLLMERCLDEQNGL